MKDNSIVFKGISIANEKINGKGKTPPDYERLTNPISKAITKVIQEKKTGSNK